MSRADVPAAAVDAAARELYDAFLRHKARAILEAAADKRFTDAELLAEFHCARADYDAARRHPSRAYWTPLGVDEDATAEMALKRSTTMLHFATRPHYDEAE